MIFSTKSSDSSHQSRMRYLCNFCCILKLYFRFLRLAMSLKAFLKANPERAVEMAKIATSFQGAAEKVPGPAAANNATANSKRRRESARVGDVVAAADFTAQTTTTPSIRRRRSCARNRVAQALPPRRCAGNRAVQALPPRDRTRSLPGAPDVAWVITIPSPKLSAWTNMQRASPWGPPFKFLLLWY